MTKLKPKNREYLEKWYAESQVNSIEWWKDYVIQEICLYGMHGAKDLTDKELLATYKDYVRC